MGKKHTQTRLWNRDTQILTGKGDRDCRKVLVETGGQVVEVDLSRRRCTCGQQRCGHIKKAVGFLESPKIPVDIRFAATSALHKEIRRGDVEAALYWTAVLARNRRWNVKHYARSVIFEETRNWGLFRTAKERYRATTVEELVRLITRSRKKWEMNCRKGLFTRKLLAAREVLNTPSSERPNPRDELRKAVKEHSRGNDSAVDRAYRGLFHVYFDHEDSRKDKDRKDQADAALAEFTDIIRNLARPVLGDVVDLVNEKVDNLFAPAALLEVALGIWDNSGDDFCHPDVVEEPDLAVVRDFPPYAFDAHTSKGKTVLRRNLDRIEYGRPLPEGLDLRFSGQEVGCLWRELAFEKFGMDYLNRRWEEVPPPPQDVVDAMWVTEKQSYPKLFI